MKKNSIVLYKNKPHRIVYEYGDEVILEESITKDIIKVDKKEIREV